MMNRAVAFIFSMLLVSLAGADTLTLQNGQTMKGRLTGFSERKFTFATADGSTYSGYPLDIKTIVPDAPLKVSVKFSMKQYDSAEFIQFDQNTLRLRKNQQTLAEPVMFLKTMQCIAPADPDRPPQTETNVSDPASPRPDMEEAPKPRSWQRADKWREVEEDRSTVISRGEEVNIDAALKRGFVNVVQFHHPRSLASVREGNYIQALASKRSNRVVLLRVVVQDFKAPILVAQNIQGLPQFWVYSAQGKLIKKLTDRFTEGDIDAAIKEAHRVRSL
ncbi:MAG: hypothetical protein WCL49_00855 [bacterium]